MMCAWKALLRILPPWIRRELDGKMEQDLQELRLRLGQPPELVCRQGSGSIAGSVSMEDLRFTVNTASQYSPWAAQTVAEGYITAAGGHRIGICGEAAVDRGAIRGIRGVRSLCVRVARDYPGIAADLPQTGSVLILGPPGAGKTTLLRDLIRQRSDRDGCAVAVVDERGELFPSDFSPGKRVDILTGCSKGQGIPMVLRTMGPAAVAVDEITAAEDARVLGQAFGCGVEILATAHGATMEDLWSRQTYRTLMEQKVFRWVVILQRDKSMRTERVT